MVRPRKGLTSYAPRARQRKYRVRFVKHGRAASFICWASTPLEAQNRAIATLGESYLSIINVEIFKP